MKREGFQPVRCQHCHARLFDTDGQLVRAGIEVRIKCWRCGEIITARLDCRGDQDTQQWIEESREVWNGP